MRTYKKRQIKFAKMSYNKDEDCIMYLNLPYFKNTSKT